MHTARAAGRDDDRLRSCHQIIAGLHVQENGTCHLIFLVADQLDCRSKFYDRNTAVDDFITQRPHDLCSGVVLARMHSLSGCSAAVRRDHRPVRILIKHDSQLIQPLDRIRRLHDQLLQKLRSCSKMPAAKCIEIMLYRRVIFFVRCLDTAFRHHCICIADAKLCHNHDIRSRLMCLDRCRSTCSAAADDEHIHVIVNL